MPCQAARTSAVDAAADAIRALIPHRTQTEEPVELEGDVAVATTDAPDLVQLEGEIAADGSVVPGQ